MLTPTTSAIKKYLYVHISSAKQREDLEITLNATKPIVTKDIFETASSKVIPWLKSLKSIVAVNFSDMHAADEDCVDGTRTFDFLSSLVAIHNAGTKKRKRKVTVARGKRQKTEGMLNHTTLHHRHSTSTGLENGILAARSLGLFPQRITSNYSKRNKYTCHQPHSEAVIEAMDELGKICLYYCGEMNQKMSHHYDITEKRWLNPMTFQPKRLLFDDVSAIYVYAHRYKNKHVLWPLHFEKITSGPIRTRSHVIASSLTIAKLMNESLPGYMRRKNTFTKLKRMALFMQSP
ncbi:hypothetical protein G9A89_015443 [Geosiphon pyriformis]|nr:hypothetical protein G9A89_015443 [Geosiphon pyriformis]